MLRLFITLIVFAIVSFSTQANALTVKDVRFGVHSDKTRLVIELDQPSKFRSFMLPEIEDKPYRLVIDMPEFDWKAGKVTRPPKTDVLDVRAGTLQAGIKRLVIDLNQPAKIKTAFLLPANKQSPDRLVVDFNRISKSAFKKTSRTPIGNLKIEDAKTNIAQTTKNIAPVSSSNLKANKSAPKPAPSNTPKSSPQSPLHKKLIVIDAGHGGVDPGAIGAGKQKEKDVTLAAAQILKKRLDATGRYQVYLTRDNDRFIKLHKRRQIARDKGADLFLSLHADSINKPNIRGASVYTLSNKASDAQTAKLAARENQSDLIAGVDLSHEDKDVANILLDLAMRDTMNQSKFFANIVVDNMRNRGMSKNCRGPHRCH